MTDHDSAVTAAELDEQIALLSEHAMQRGNPYRKVMRDTVDLLTSLRKQLVEARRECDELNRSIFGLYDTCAKYRASNAQMAAALREAISLLTRERDLLDRERPNMTKSKDWRYDPPATEAELQYWEGYRRGVDLAIRTLTPASQEAPASNLLAPSAREDANNPAPASPSPGLTEDQIERHKIRAADCPPDTEVLLVNSVRRLSRPVSEREDGQ